MKLNVQHCPPSCEPDWLTIFVMTSDCCGNSSDRILQIGAFEQIERRRNRSMNELHRKGKIAWQLVRNYPIAALGGWRYQDVFADVETYCMFIGYSRSGKTMIASLLDAHPNLIIADELDALQYIYAGFSRRQIYYLLIFPMIWKIIGNISHARFRGMKMLKSAVVVSWDDRHLCG